MVGFVEDRDLDAGQRAGAPVEQVDQPAGRGDDDVHAVPHPGDLPPDRHAAVDGRDAHAHAAAERREHVGHLLGQLPGRHQDQPARRPVAPLSRADGGPGQPGEHRQAEREGLARARLGPAEHVASSQRVRQRPRLDRERLVNVARRKGADQPLRQADRAERGRRGDGLGCRIGQGPVEPGVGVGLRRAGLAGALRGGAATAAAIGAPGALRAPPGAPGAVATAPAAITTAARGLAAPAAFLAGARRRAPCIVRHA